MEKFLKIALDKQIKKESNMFGSHSTSPIKPKGKAKGKKNCCGKCK